MIVVMKWRWALGKQGSMEAAFLEAFLEALAVASSFPFGLVDCSWPLLRLLASAAGHEQLA